MTLGMDPLTLVHVLITLIAIVAGLMVLADMMETAAAPAGPPGSCSSRS